MAFILSIAKQIQLEFQCDIKPVVFFIGTNFRGDMMWSSSVVASQNKRVHKEQTRSQPMFSPACESATYSSTRMSRRKNVDNGLLSAIKLRKKKWLLVSG